MAKYKAQMPVVAQRTVTAGVATFSSGAAVGKMVQTTVNPTFDKAELYGDDKKAESLELFVEAAIGLNTSCIPTVVASMIFGVTRTPAVTTQGSEAPENMHYVEDDEAPYVGYGFIHGEVNEGVKRFVVTWLPKVKFTQPNETYDTKGKTVAFSTSTIAGVAEADESGGWKDEFYFDTAAQAVAKLKALADID